MLAAEVRINRILVVRNDRFGEFLLNIPALRALRQSFPQARITAVVDPYVKELAAKVPFIDSLLQWQAKEHSFLELIAMARKIRKENFDLAVILNPSREFNLITFFAGIPLRLGYRKKWPFLLTRAIEDDKYLCRMHEVEYNLRLVALAGARTEDTSLELKGLPEPKADSGGDFVIIHPFTSDPLKQWPLENFKELASAICRLFNQRVIIVGGKEELKRSRENFSLLGPKITDMTGKTTLLELAALLKRGCLLISADSGPVHLASAVGTAVIALFRNDLVGKTAKRWGPWGKAAIVIEKENLHQITVAEVLGQVKEILNR